jgi:hypothetical protein
MTHEEIRADLSSFALDVLEPSALEEIVRHLASGCGECEQELASWKELVGVIALAGPDANAPNLKPALLARVRGPQPRRPRGRVITMPRWSIVPLAAAATVALAVGIARESAWRGRFGGQQAQLATARTKLSAAETAMQRLTQELAAKDQDVTSLRAALAAAHESLAIVQTPGLQLVRLKEAPQAQPGEGHVLIGADGRALFYAFALQALPPDKTYELWWITEKEGPVNAGVFRPDDRGLGRVDTKVPTESGLIKAAAVTIEPAAGVAKPTGPMVLLGNVG